jgi:ketosteroid isomerase-like protein
MDLHLTVANRRIAPDHATEFGAFQQSYRDSSGARNTEYGRYVALLVRQGDGSWRMDRFFGFEDSTRANKPQSTP